MPQSIQFRKAQERDAATIAHFNAAMALETEHKVLMPEIIGAGVRKLLATPSMGFYVVAESGERVVASLMITNEWSDWRCGLFWWIQSVYVEPAFRRQGVYRRLYEYVQELAQADSGVCGFRLYVEKDNTVAQQTYASLGMGQTDYLIYEELKPGIRYFTPADRS
ncbi:GNAT family N-acetyltransferase [Caenimonas koreensis]|uniref:GNAT family N-acetyltransferase n=1 Tax=Caenimonas koreensis TaxID=367474 RepID=UPI0037832E08